MMPIEEITKQFTELRQTGKHGMGKNKIRTWLFDVPDGVRSLSLSDPEVYVDFSDSYELADTLFHKGYYNSIIKIIGSGEMLKVHVGNIESAEQLIHKADVVLNPVGDVLDASDEIRQMLPLRDWASSLELSTGYYLLHQGDKLKRNYERQLREAEFLEHSFRT